MFQEVPPPIIRSSKLYIQFWAPEDGSTNRLEHVEYFTELNKLCNVAYCWLDLKIEKIGFIYSAILPLCCVFSQFVTRSFFLISFLQTATPCPILCDPFHTFYNFSYFFLIFFFCTLSYLQLFISKLCLKTGTANAPVFFNVIPGIPFGFQGHS